MPATCATVAQYQCSFSQAVRMTGSVSLSGIYANEIRCSALFTAANFSVIVIFPCTIGGYFDQTIH